MSKNTKPENNEISTEENSGIEAKYIFSLSILFLIVVVGLTVLLASGALRYGLSGPFIFVIYVVSGLLVAIACFGLLSSSGDITGHNFGAKWRVGGAIVGFIVVAVGGSLYETYVRSDQKFDIQIILIDNKTKEFAKVKGTIKLVIGSETETIVLDKSGVAQIRNLPTNWDKEQARVFLLSTSWRMLSTEDRDITLQNKSTIYFQVERKPLFASYDESEINFVVEGSISDQMLTGERTFTIYVTAVSKSGNAVPIRGQGELVITNNGLDLRRLSADISDGTMTQFVILQDNLPTQLFVNGMMPPDWEYLLDRMPDSYIKFYYYDTNKVNVGVYESQLFEISRQFFGITE
ncbi:MAG: hypothetical protein AB2551_13575 [Candidatus Thiodiazotropha sp.]